MPRPASLSVLSTLALRPALSRVLLTEDNRHGCGHPLVRFEAGSVLVQTLQHDPAGADLFVGPEGITLALAARGILQSDASVMLVQSETAFAVRKNHPVQCLSNDAAIDRLLREATRLCRSNAESGQHLEHIARCFDLSRLVASKSLHPPPGELVGHVLERGDADVGFQQISELRPFDGIRILRLPAGHRHGINYLLTPFSHCATQPGRLEQVLALMAHLGARHFDPLWRMSGLEPVRSRQT